MTHIALLRGINVGGKNILPMKELAALFQEHGAKQVKTYIQSGNVVFRTEIDPDEIARQVEAQILERFAITTPIILRTAEELDFALRNNPFVARGEEEGLYVLFLKHMPTPEAVAALDPLRSPPDEFLVQRREVFMRLLSAATTKLTNAYFDSKLKTVGTARNWRTVATLCEMASTL